MYFTRPTPEEIKRGDYLLDHSIISYLVGSRPQRARPALLAACRARCRAPRLPQPSRLRVRRAQIDPEGNFLDYFGKSLSRDEMQTKMGKTIEAWETAKWWEQVVPSFLRDEPAPQGRRDAAAPRPAA